tara:strand:+ start:179 stop:361 length:183 start_codon:yes stop_codon:yes gene_type:complete
VKFLIGETFDGRSINNFFTGGANGFYDVLSAEGFAAAGVGGIENADPFLNGFYGVFLEMI